MEQWTVLACQPLAEGRLGFETARDRELEKFRRGDSMVDPGFHNFVSSPEKTLSGSYDGRKLAILQSGQTGGT